MADSISLEELVALNDEIAGLVRSGVPLELGLAGWGQSLHGRLGRIVRQLSQSIAQGKSLSQSLDESSARFPSLYRAVVTAGLRSGRLPAALESLATSARNLQEVRRAIILAVLYPLVLLLLGYFAVWLVVGSVLPAILEMYEGNPPPLWAAVASAGQWANRELRVPLTSSSLQAGYLPPLVVLVAALVGWSSMRRATVFGAGSLGLARWMPFAGKAARDAQLAALAEILGLLVEQNVPLDEAVVLAADATGDRRLADSARALAQSLEQGGTPPRAENLLGFPPLLAWLMSTGGRQQTFVTVARHVADTYRRRIARHNRWLREYLPLWLVVIIGGGLVVLVGLLTMVPFSGLMSRLGEIVNTKLRVSP
ncbi:MAG: type II secretion system F family protein [Pirellulales bacterium]